MALKLKIFDQLKTYFGSLNEREQILVGLASIMVAGVFIYQTLGNLNFLFKPTVYKDLLAKQQKIEELRPQLEKYIELKQLKHAVDGVTIEELYDEVYFKKPKLAVLDNDEMEVNTKNELIEIQYKAVSFDDLIKWLEKYHKKFGVSVVSADIEAIPGKQGYVSAILLLGT